MCRETNFAVSFTEEARMLASRRMRRRFLSLRYFPRLDMTPRVVHRFHAELPEIKFSARIERYFIRMSRG